MNNAERQARKKLQDGKPLNPPLGTGFRILARTCPRCGLFWTTPIERWVIRPGDRKTGMTGSCPECTRRKMREYRSTHLTLARERDRSAARREQRDASRKRKDAELREDATHHRSVWTSAEMEIAARRDLTAREVAVKLGRTMTAVRLMRRRLREDPRAARLAGLDTDVARLADPGTINIAPRYAE